MKLKYPVAFRSRDYNHINLIIEQFEKTEEDYQLFQYEGFAYIGFNLKTLITISSILDTWNLIRSNHTKLMPGEEKCTLVSFKCDVGKTLRESIINLVIIENGHPPFNLFIIQGVVVYQINSDYCINYGLGSKQLDLFMSKKYIRVSLMHDDEVNPELINNLTIDLESSLTTSERKTLYRMISEKLVKPGLLNINDPIIRKIHELGKI